MARVRRAQIRESPCDRFHSCCQRARRCGSTRHGRGPRRQRSARRFGSSDRPTPPVESPATECGRPCRAAAGCGPTPRSRSTSPRPAPARSAPVWISPSRWACWSPAARSRVTGSRASGSSANWASTARSGGCPGVAPMVAVLPEVVAVVPGRVQRRGPRRRSGRRARRPHVGGGGGGAGRGGTVARRSGARRRGARAADRRPQRRAGSATGAQRAGDRRRGWPPPPDGGAAGQRQDDAGAATARSAPAARARATR